MTENRENTFSSRISSRIPDSHRDSAVRTERHMGIHSMDSRGSEDTGSWVGHKSGVGGKHMEDNRIVGMGSHR